MDFQYGNHTAEKAKEMELDYAGKNYTTMRSLGVFYDDPVYVSDLVHPTHDYSTIVYSAILAFGVLANLYLFVRCFRSDKGHHQSKARLHLSHVVLANLMVCFFTIPVEIGWRWTVEWRAGNAGCKVLQFARVIGLYALSMNLAAIAVDKVVEVRQLIFGGYSRRSPVTAVIFALSWIASALFSCPQLYVFHAGYTSYSSTILQCVGIESFTLGYEQMYNVIMLSCMFFIPWSVMILAYVYIFHTVKSALDFPEDLEQYALTSSIQADGSSSGGPQPRPRVFSQGAQSRTSNMSSWGTTFSQRTMSTSIESNVGDLTAHGGHFRATGGNFVLLDDSFERELRIFTTISGTVVLTCLPYIAFTVWYLIDSHSHGQIHPILQELPFVLVLANTVLIPAVYALKLCVVY